MEWVLYAAIAVVLATAFLAAVGSSSKRRDEAEHRAFVERFSLASADESFGAGAEPPESEEGRDLVDPRPGRQSTTTERKNSNILDSGQPRSDRSPQQGRGTAPIPPRQGAD
jgi:hypothetical protein